ncbi:NACHT domain-containing protein [Nonomuraea sp. NPDC049695]|uniref:NACHT and WD40 repeat domain-containing protein n=1 Tax=Nonomuraea sp. NPDC049695 TaxID=3154734 RepID=UPI00341BEE93
MSELDLVVHYLEEWAAGKPGRSNTPVARLLDAALERLHVLVTERLGRSPTTAALAAEAAADPVFAGKLAVALGEISALRAAQKAGAVEAGPKALAQTGTEVRQSVTAQGGGPTIVAAGQQSVAAQNVGAIFIQQHITAPDPREREIRAQLLACVRAYWVDGVLADVRRAQPHWLELGATLRNSAVDHPFGAWVREYDQPDQPLAGAASLLEIAMRFNGHLLVLGEPGSGKTAMLLTYLSDLLRQAEEDADCRIPVYFQLATWTVAKGPLAKWLADELRERYGMPAETAAKWVTENRFAVLLDGLDEVVSEEREACLQAINQYNREHGLVPLAVCSRTADYESLTGKLRLKGAVVIHPLAPSQIEEFLQAGGDALAGVLAAIRSDAQLAQIVSFPLMLSLVAAISAGPGPVSVPGPGDLEERRAAIVATYAERMLARPRGAAEALRRPKDRPYQPDDSHRWLSWIAWELHHRNLVDFYPDWMQPNWLPDQRGARWLRLGLPMLEVAILGLAGALLIWLISVTVSLPYASSIAGALLGLDLVLIFLAQRGIEPVEPIHISPELFMRRQRWRATLFVIWVSMGTAMGVGIVAALITAVLVTELQILSMSADAPTALRPQVPGKGIRAAGRGGLVRGALHGLAAGIMSGVCYEGLEPGTGLPLGGLTALLTGLACLFSVGGNSYLRHRLLVRRLRGDRLIPSDMVAFLDHATDHLILNRVGGGYQFAHRIIRDHFAGRAEAIGGDALQLSRLPHPEPVFRSERLGGVVISLAFTPEGRHLAAGTRAAEAVLWDTAEGDEAARFWHGMAPTKVRRIDAVAISPDGRTLATGSWDRQVMLWDISDPRRPTRGSSLKGHRRPVAGLAFHPGGSLLATASQDRTAGLWDLSDPFAPTRVATLTGHGRAVRTVAFSMDGAWLATGGRDGNVLLWDVREPSEPTVRHRLRCRSGWVFAAVFSPDGRLLAVAGRDATVSIWGLGDSPTQLARITGQTRLASDDAALTTAFSPQGHLLLTGTSMSCAILWDISDPRSPVRVATLGNQGTATAAVFTPDGRRLATGSLDQTVVLWDLEEDR